MKNLNSNSRISTLPYGDTHCHYQNSTQVLNQNHMCNTSENVKFFANENMIQLSCNTESVQGIADLVEIFQTMPIDLESRILSSVNREHSLKLQELVGGPSSYPFGMRKLEEEHPPCKPVTVPFIGIPAYDDTYPVYAIGNAEMHSLNNNEHSIPKNSENLIEDISSDLEK